LRALFGEGDDSELAPPRRAEDDQHAKGRAALRLYEGMLAEAEARHGEAVEAYDDALRFFRLTDRPYQVACIQLRLGAALLARGEAPDRSRARHELTEARNTFARLGAAQLETADALLRSHRLVASGPRGGGEALSEREREIASLVAAGLSNPQIAKELVLSPKTVEHHVSRILGKLQLTSRAALAAHVSAQANRTELPK
jgi:DNA-binding CsgD family transcriptional regulator